MRDSWEEMMAYRWLRCVGGSEGVSGVGVSGRVEAELKAAGEGEGEFPLSEGPAGKAAERDCDSGRGEPDGDSDGEWGILCLGLKAASSSCR